MVFFLHAVEGPDGRWTCRRGRNLLDPQAGEHPHVSDALEHLHGVGRTLEGLVQIMLHFTDGTTRSVEVED